MCGINGMIFLKGVERSEDMMNKVRFVFNELMVETEDRGHHATGLASFNRNGEYEFYKAATKATLMATNDDDYLDIVKNFDSENTSAVIAHTRYYTKGLPSNNKNNHPFDIGNIVGLHNGSVKNDDLLFKEYGFDRVGEVDSEIIFHLINHYNQNSISYGGLHKALESTKIRGLFALAFMNKNQPNLVHLVKQEKPMYIATWKEAGIVIFNSDDDYINNAFFKLQRAQTSFGMDITVDTVDIKRVADDSYFTVDSNATDFENCFSEVEKLVLETSTVPTYYNNKYSKTYTTGGTQSKKDTHTPDYKKVTATDNNGVTLHGEIDRITGEVLIYTNDDITDADDGSGLDIDFEECMECFEVLTEDEIIASYNDFNPAGGKVCESCYSDAIKSHFAYDEEVDGKVIV